MGYARSETVRSDVPGFYHCISRVVRRAMLCGEDPVTGKNFDYRRVWVEKRLVDLSKSFAVGLYAWSVMGNHTHVVLRLAPQAPDGWSDKEVAQRWTRLSRTLKPVDEAKAAERAEALLKDRDVIKELRRRLGSISWFMRFLNECIALEANREDECTGRFWEGRFHCQALLDESAVLACMVYADLNPIRAGIADDLHGSDFTAVQRRLRELQEDDSAADDVLPVLAGSADPGAGPAISIRSYIELVEWSGRLARPDKRGHISAAVPAALEGIRGSADWWRGCVHRVEEAFGRAVGTPQCLREYVDRMGRGRVRGL